MGSSLSKNIKDLRRKQQIQKHHSDDQIRKVFSSVPRDILMRILSKLPVEDISICRCVCKEWLHTLTSLDFVIFHLHNSQSNAKFIFREYTKESILANFCIVDCQDLSFRCAPLPLKRYGIELYTACDGLVGMSMVSKNECILALWNPSTHEYKIIETISSRCDFGLLGFGYDSSSRDYKIVRQICDYPKVGQHRLDVYSLKTNTWTTVIGMSDQDIFWYFPKQDAFLKNSIYWLVSRSRDTAVASAIKRFDLKSEQFTDLKLASRDRWDWKHILQLTVIGECLGMYCSYENTSGDRIVEIWKNEGDWVKLNSVSFHREGAYSTWVTPIRYFRKTKEIVYMAIFRKRFHREPEVELQIYDTNMQMVERVTTNSLVMRGKFVAYFETLVSPNTVPFD